MNLLLDIGNTSLRWTLEKGGCLGPVAGVRHGQALPADLLAAWEVLTPPRRVLVSNVGGSALGGAVTRVVRACWGLTAEFAATRQDCLGLRVAYAEPARLGVDRWLALLGAAGQGAEACGALILDAGTAATVDALAPGGRHLGGLILPGLAMMRDSLLAGTQIPAGAPESAAEPWAADTGAAVATGGRHALAALAERVHRRLCEHLSQTAAGSPAGPPLLLVTGGDAERIAPLIGRPFALVPDLVLQGLARLAGAWSPA